MRSLRVVCAALVVAALCVMAYAHGRGHRVHDRFVHSHYERGTLRHRTVTSSDTKMDEHDVVLRAEEEAGPILRGLLRFVVSAETDGLRVHCAEREAYLTPDDLRAHGAYEGNGFGTKQPVLESLMHEQLGDVLLPHCTFFRVRYATDAAPPITEVRARASAHTGAQYLVRGMSPDGRFAYTLDGRTGAGVSDYNLPRHAGTQAFLARAGRVLGDPSLVSAARKAETYLRLNAYRTCSGLPCVTTDDTALLGASALALVALVELVQAGDDALSLDVAAFAKTLRAAQRNDGEFKHAFDLRSQKAIDVQYPYYSSEAVYALARAYEVTKSPEDLEAAVRGLRYLVGPGWRFFGSAYYRAEEHWTCQAMAALWSASRNLEALEFCTSWFDVQVRMFQPTGGFTPTPLFAPRLTPVASRTEASLAIAEVLRAEGRSTRVIDAQSERSLGLLAHAQFLPGPTHLFADPEQMYGAIPGSFGDITVRIDYVQHAGSAMLTYVSRASASRKDQ